MSEHGGTDKATVAVIGAGVIGLAVAFRLALEKRKVLLIDRKEPGREASYGNAGHIATEQIFPLASLSTLLNVPGFLSRGDRPLSIRREYAMHILPWLLRFTWYASPHSFRRGRAALSALLSGAMAALEGLLDEASMSSLLHQRGHMILVEKEKSKAAMQAQPASLADYDIAAEWLEPNAVAERVPQLLKGISGALLFRDTGHVSDPYLVCTGLHEAFLAAGGRFVRGDAKRLVADIDGGFEIDVNSRKLRAEKVVIAAGAWSKELTSQLGHDVPLETERGYHINADGWHAHFDIPIASHERMVIMTPLDGGLRMTGFVEFGGLQLPPDQRHVETLQRHLGELLPGARTPDLKGWMGFRPSLPDYLPVIGSSPDNPNALFAFGHQHLGLTLAGVTSDIVAALAGGRESAVDLHPFRVNRFQ